ncbi:MarR family winged helix-turn-helix transcriptional regulator [Albirhodobacter sp. R86504]|jgi:DNA-binding MarR family transcriptional regulator|uniref:MarR family winged helix-turn-helix transcriptional regulator n=1 Tax=Albirhodobacter sp. R86504 TaxID=3093848 RepID=UPI0036718CD6
MKTHGLHYILHSAEILEDRLRKRLARLDLLPRQARVIDALARMGKASQVTLAREFSITPASMSTMTLRLVLGGWISRVPNPDDPRGNILELTEKGRALHADIQSAWADIDALIYSLLGDDDASSLLAGAAKLHSALGARPPGGDGQSKADPERL